MEPPTRLLILCFLTQRISSRCFHLALVLKRSIVNLTGVFPQMIINTTRLCRSFNSGTVPAASGAAVPDAQAAAGAGPAAAASQQHCQQHTGQSLPHTLPSGFKPLL